MLALDIVALNINHAITTVNKTTSANNQTYIV